MSCRWSTSPLVVCISGRRSNTFHLKLSPSIDCVHMGAHIRHSGQTFWRIGGEWATGDKARMRSTVDGLSIRKHISEFWFPLADTLRPVAETRQWIKIWHGGFDSTWWAVARSRIQSDIIRPTSRSCSISSSYWRVTTKPSRYYAHHPGIRLLVLSHQPQLHLLKKSPHRPHLHARPSSIVSECDSP